MEHASNSAVLDRILDPLTEAFTPEVARQIVNLRADAPTQALIDQLGEKASDGTLTPAEHRQYSSYVQAGTLISILQAKARTYLANQNGL